MLRWGVKTNKSERARFGWVETFDKTDGMFAFDYWKGEKFGMGQQQCYCDGKESTARKSITDSWTRKRWTEFCRWDSTDAPLTILLDLRNSKKFIHWNLSNSQYWQTTYLPHTFLKNTHSYKWYRLFSKTNVRSTLDHICSPTFIQITNKFPHNKPHDSLKPLKLVF